VSGGRAKGGVEGEEEEGLVRRPVSSTRGRVRKVRPHWTSGDPEGNGNVFDDPDVDSDSPDDNVEGDEEWRRSRGMDPSPARQSRRGQSPFDVEESSLGSGSDRVLRGVEKDNLKWPAGEGWKPL